MENCGGESQILKIDPNVTVSLTKKCEIIIKGCGETKPFKTLTVEELQRQWRHTIIVNYPIIFNRLNTQF